MLRERFDKRNSVYNPPTSYSNADLRGPSIQLKARSTSRRKENPYKKQLFKNSKDNSGLIPDTVWQEFKF